ncbi:MAG TPA: DNA repair protein RecN [Elusimicrobiota bacterium]|nr:DNA repair protein RecN [Elusimicrobiota bacterium]
MLNYLSIKNFALIEDMFLEFTPGLNVLTGETGAGKTIVIEALGLVLGDKASASQARKGAARLSVVAEFRLSAPRLKRLLRELDLAAEEGDQLLLRRELDAGGRSRCFVNDNPVNLSTLARIGEHLAYIHGQHEHQLLLKSSEQLDVLDTFGRLEPLRQTTAEAHGRWKALLAEQQAVSLSDQERAQRVDLYRFQLTELKTAQLKTEGEDEDLERLLPQLKNAERLKNLSQQSYDLLYGSDGSALDNVRRVQRDVETLQSLGGDLRTIPDMIAESAVRLEEAAHELEAFKNRVDLDPERLDEVLSRLDVLGKLKRKYGPALKDVMAHQTKIEEELKYLENAEERTRDLSEKLAKAQSELKDVCLKLSQARTAAAKKLAAAVEKEFHEVGLPHAAFDVAVEKNPDGPATAAGFDAVRFLFSPNPGEGRQPLADIASGGELSRVMLALKSVLARADEVPTLVFDEIDAGVGGRLGGVIGKKLARLGKTHQVLCITHLAPIAACAQNHFYVEKHVVKDRTSTTIKKLQEEGRVLEIARMFGGAAEKTKDESISVKHAKELLATSRT